MVILSAIFGAISGVIGTILSSVVSKLPTGPMIVIVISIIVIFSLGFAPNRGLIWKYFRDRKKQREINEDQVLVNLYHLAMNHEDINHSHDIFIIKPNKSKTGRTVKELTSKLESLRSRGFVKKDYFNKWAITEKGLEYVENHFKKEEI